MFYEETELAELIDYWNANAFKTVSLYSARASIEKRLAPAYKKGYTVEQLKSVIDKVRENNGGGYIDDSIYKTLSVRNIKDILDETPIPAPAPIPDETPDETPAKPQGGGVYYVYGARGVPCTT